MHEHLTCHPRRRAPPVPAALAAELAGFSETDAAWILAVIAANYAPTTLTVYAYVWGQSTAWCAGRGLTPLPATPGWAVRVPD